MCEASGAAINGVLHRNQSLVPLMVLKRNDTFFNFINGTTGPASNSVTQESCTDAAVSGVTPMQPLVRHALMHL